MNMYYLKLANVPIITLSALGSSNSTSTPSTNVTIATTGATTGATSASSAPSTSTASSTSSSSSSPATTSSTTTTTTTTTTATTSAAAAAASIATSSLSTTTTPAITTTSGSTTIVTTPKTNQTLVLRASGLNPIKPAVGLGVASSHRSKSQISVVTGSTITVRSEPSKQSPDVGPLGATGSNSTSSGNSIGQRTNGSEIGASRLECSASSSPSGNNNSPTGASSSSGNAAAARLIDLGKQLIEATREGQTETVRQLTVDSGAPFTSDWLGTTALHVAAQNGFVEIARILLNGGVNRDAKTKLDRTALHLAAQSGSVDIVDMLVTNGADVNARDMLKMTPMHWAVERGHPRVVERLLVAGSDLTTRNKFQLTPFDIARNSQSFDVIKILNNWTGASGAIFQQQQQQQQQSYLDNGQQNHLPSFGQHQAATNFNSNTDLNQLFHYGTTSFSSDDSPLMAQITNGTNNGGTPFGATTRNTLFRNHQSQLQHSSNGAMISKSLRVDDSLHQLISNNNESHDFSDIDQQLALIDCATGGGMAAAAAAAAAVARSVRSPNRQANLPLDNNSGTNSPTTAEDKCIDLVEFGWNNMDFAPELFMPVNDSDDGESNVEYLMKVVEELQKENKQLRQQVEQLSTTSP